MTGCFGAARGTDARGDNFCFSCLFDTSKKYIKLISYSVNEYLFCQFNTVKNIIMVSIVIHKILLTSFSCESYFW